MIQPGRKIKSIITEWIDNIVITRKEKRGNV